MIQFPETAWAEWKIIHDAAEAEIELRAKIKRGIAIEKELETIRVRHQAKELLNQELSADQTPELKMVTGTEFLQNAALTNPPTDLIEGVMKDEGLCIVLGPAGSGKTTLVLQMLHSLNKGIDWLGQATQVVKNIGFLSYDQAAHITFGWLNASGFDMDKISLVDAYKTGNPLNVPDMRAKIIAEWKARAVEVVVIDSFSASFFGADQNDNALTMAHYRNLKLFAMTEVGARAMIVLAHASPDRTDKIRGASAHHEVADSIVAMEGKDSDPRKIKMLKYRAGIGEQQMSPVIITAPDAVTHLVDLDVGEMALAGMHLPPSAAGAVLFPELPDTTADPDTDSEEEGDDDL